MLDSFTAARNPSNEPVRNLHCLLPRAIQTIPMAWISESLFSPSKEHQSLVFDFMRRIRRASPVFDVAIGAWWNLNRQSRTFFEQSWSKKVLGPQATAAKKKRKKPSGTLVCFDRSRSQCDLNHSQRLDSNPTVSFFVLSRYICLLVQTQIKPISWSNVSTIKSKRLGTSF